MYKHGSDSRSIGKPFLRCPDCQCLIIDKDRNEWELKGFFGKVAYIFICGWSSLLYGFLFPLVALGLGKLFGFSLSERAFLYIYIAGVLSFLVLGILIESQDIRESKERMKDPSYRDFLKEIGLLR